jgi:hypothetical protein
MSIDYPHEPITPNNSDPFVSLTISEKNSTVRFLVHDQRFPVHILRKMATRHAQISVTQDQKKLSADNLRAAFDIHKCTDACLILRSEAELAGLHPVNLAPNELQQCKLNLRSNSRKRKPAALDDPDTNTRRKRQRQSIEFGSMSFPIILSQDEKDDIVREFRAATDNTSLLRYECSFCGKFEKAILMTMRAVTDLDISLLERAVMQLRVTSRQHRIQSFESSSVVNGSYILCHLCNSAVSKKKFHSIPLRSYANGLWIGKVPEQLRDLTFLEEQCIARARATKCMYKLTLGPSGQLAARGNVCILPQDTNSFISAMPIPLFRLKDEICVILVGSPDTQVTYDMLKKSPLLVRRERIRVALFWLIENNPLYADLDKDVVLVNSEEYPVYDCPFALADILRTNSANNQGSSYTTYSDQANTTLFEGTDDSFELTSSTLEDIDSVASTYQQRKLDALRRLKKQEAEFVKFPSGNTPLSTSKNPRIFAWLWPTLFPYGVGMIDNNNVRLSSDFPFHQVDTSTHVQQLLALKDNRFQVHKSFIFVISNIIQRRQSSFKARLATNRSWFPVVQSLMQKIDAQSMNMYQAKLDNNPFAKPETEGEMAAVKVMRYISYVSDHIPGSVGDVNTMKQQIHSKIICEGLPHIFATVNPADSHNPIAQVLAGRDINLDTIFHALDGMNKEPSIRARTLAENPVAGAEFFHLMITKFLDIILGVKRVSKIGILGKVKGWYAVVEAQIRGSLHLHLLIWIEDAPASPLDMKERINSDLEFKKKLLAWYDDIICQSFPEDTVSYLAPVGAPRQLCVLSRPADPDSPDYKQKRGQYHRDLCDNTGLVHAHGSACFKHIPRHIQSLLEPDSDCRFRLPRPLVSETHFDEDGDLQLRCENGSLNGHNPTATLTLGCNNDFKQTAAGSVALAMVEYMASYTVKLQLDTAVVYAALCASIQTLQDKPPQDADGQIDQAEMTRLLMVKTTNSLVGKRELSGQQTATLLLGRKNNYTSDDYQEYWWSSMLRDIARDIFTIEIEGSMPHHDEDEPSDLEAAQRVIIPDDEDDNMMLLTSEMLSKSPETEKSSGNRREKKYSTLFNDIFFRPSELRLMCVWDILRNYVKEKKPNSKTHRKTYLNFGQGHPQYTTHCLKKLDTSVVPVLMGYRIPRCDSEDDHIKYAVIILTLFKVWSNTKCSLLKSPDTAWSDAFNEFRPSMSAEHVRIMLNMQLLYQTRDAKFDYAAERTQRLTELTRMAKDQGIPNNCDADQEYDPVWENAMQTSSDPEELDADNSPLGKDTWASRDAQQIVVQAEGVGFYSVQNPPNNETSTKFKQKTRLGDDDDIFEANIAAKALLKDKDMLIKNRLRASAANHTEEDMPHHKQTASRIPEALSTTLAHEVKRAYELYDKRHTSSSSQSPDSPWNCLHAYQQLCLALIVKHTLNDEQTRTFLLLADKIGRDLETKNKDPPMSLLCTGPGGAGKSVIFGAWKDFYDITGHPERVRLTAPTGVVASDIGGCTIHAEASLRVAPALMKSKPKFRTNLEERISPLETLILDEVYFLSAQDVATLSEYLCMGKGVTDYICGGLNWATCGDPCQLPPPGGSSLFARQLVQCHLNDNLNDLHESTRQEVKGIQVWHQVQHVVVLEEIMRQKGDPLLISILKRLRKGTCTEDDKIILDKYVLSNVECTEATKNLTDINRWIENPKYACPLIVYTNAARDRHNNNMTKAFAAATGQEYHLYHSHDTRGRGCNRKQLTGLAAEAAWSVPVKDAKDLGGKARLFHIDC